MGDVTSTEIEMESESCTLQQATKSLASSTTRLELYVS